MTPRIGLIFVVLFAAVVLGEWFAFFKGFNFGYWSFSNWIILLFVLLLEAAAVAIITVTIDRALPAVGNRAPSRKAKQTRRGSQKYSAR